MQPFTELWYAIHGHERRLELGPCTLIRGRNRTGKSTALKAFEWALLGVPSRSAAEHIPENQATFWAELTGPSSSARTEGVRIDGKLMNVNHARLWEAATLTKDCLVGSEDYLSFGSQRMRELLAQHFLGSDTALRVAVGACGDFRESIRDGRAALTELKSEASLLREQGHDGCADLLQVKATEIEATIKGDSQAEQVLSYKVAAALAEIKEKAEQAVNEWMPDDYRAELSIDGKDVEWKCSTPTGLLDKSLMPGSMRGALSFALRVALLPPGPCFLLIEAEQDLAYYDVKHRAGILRKLNSLQHDGRITQILIAAPDWFDGSKGTCIIEFGKPSILEVQAL